MPTSKLDIGMDLSKRILDNQLASIDQLQTKVGVLLGFDATTFGVIFAFGHAWAVGHVPEAGLSAGLLLAAAAVFGLTMRNADYLEAPDPKQFVERLNDAKETPDTVQDWAIGNLLGSFLENRKLIDQRFALVNSGIILMLLGLTAFAVGAFL